MSLHTTNHAGRLIADIDTLGVQIRTELRHGRLNEAMQTMSIRQARQRDLLVLIHKRGFLTYADYAQAVRAVAGLSPTPRD